MKFAAKILLFTSLAATFAIANCTQPGQFCHIIIVVQENTARTINFLISMISAVSWPLLKTTSG